MMAPRQNTRDRMAGAGGPSLPRCYTLRTTTPGQASVHTLDLPRGLSVNQPISARRLSRRWPISVHDFPGVEGWKPDPLADAGPRERRPPRRVPRPRPPPRGSAARRAVTRAWSRASVAQPRSDGAGRSGPQGKQVDQPGGAYALTQWRSETLRLFIPHLCPVPGWPCGPCLALPQSAGGVLARQVVGATILAI